MEEYVAEGWKECLAQEGLNHFEDWWEREAGWFEPPNHRRGGWSGVSRLEWKGKDGSRHTVFLKRQENHVTRTWKHPWKGIPTLTREMKNIVALKNAGVKALVPVFFGVKTVDGAQRAVLVTESLEGFAPLDVFQQSGLDARRQSDLIRQIAGEVRKLHLNCFQHGCLYPKHIFVKDHGDGFDVRLIDLEKLRRPWRCRVAQIRDLDTLNRHSKGWTLKDRWIFLNAYLGEATNRVERRKWWELYRDLYRKKIRKSRIT